MINDTLYDRHGAALFELVTRADGQIERRQRKRASFYFDAALGIAQQVGHDTPEKKMSRMALRLEFLGVECCFLRQMSRGRRKERSSTCFAQH